MAIMIRKKYGYTVSVTNGSRRVIACSKADWGPLKDGSLIVISGDNDFYRVYHKKQFLYTKEVEVNDPNKLTMKEHSESAISIDDTISFMSNEYEVISSKVKEVGQNYKAGDILIPENINYKFNSIDEVDDQARIEVESVDENGAIQSAKLISKGLYVSPDVKSTKAIGGSGTGAKLETQFVQSHNKRIEERTISLLDHKENGTVIHLSHPLPPTVASGIISVTKWEAMLDSPYLGQTKPDVDYEIIKDFTPNTSLPLLKGDLASSPLVYNEAMVLLDKKIKDLESKNDGMRQDILVLLAAVKELKEEN